MRPLPWILTALLCLPGAAPAQEKKEVQDLITKDGQKAIDASLAWLAKEQHEDGSFGTGQYKGNLGVTSLAGLAFLSRAREPVNKDFDKAVEKAVRFVLKHEDKQRPGFLNNQQAGFHGPMYGHGFAVLFLADAYEWIGDKKLKAEVKGVLERSVQLLVDTQNQEGGWRYMPMKADADLSVTAVQVVALRAARDVGIGVPGKTLDSAITYVKRCQDNPSGGFRYQPFGGAPGFARSAAGLTSLNRLGVKDGKEVEKATKFVKEFAQKQGEFGAAELDLHYFYGHYYAAKAMWFAGDKDWQKWYPVIRDELLKSRKDDQWKRGVMCPHYCTAMALTILQVPHEQLPSLKR